ncbi:MAG TPA: NADPH-dependent glutamate synthase [Candidatus Aphodovivens excrementavium]|nr:NADPH-dependent glutamate synthase [Candidatus Aphodovivens excrementavium]
MARRSYETNKQQEKTPMPELDPAERAKTFDEVARGYTAEDAINEARRCIQCPKAPCVDGCPVGVPIPQFIEQVANGNFAEAYDLVKGANALPAICGRVCPQETQCEGVCTRGRKGEPVGIGRLERFVADWAMGGVPSAFQPTEPADAAASGAQPADATDPEPIRDLAGKRVAVVGSGPASLTCAGELAKRGCSVRVFEALHKAGGVLTYGIPEFRLPKDLVECEISQLSEQGVEFEMNALVGKLYSIDELLDERGFDAVFVGTGAGLPSYLGIEGEGLNGVMTANELLTRVNLMKGYQFPEYDTPVYAGKKCVVSGGGNVAMDAARTALRLGAEVHIVYRRGMEEMPARAEEIHHAQEEGVQFDLLCNPVRIIGSEDGWVTGVECIRMELGEPDASGRRRPVPVEGSEFVIDADMMVIAIGSKTNPLIAQTTPGLEVTSRNLVIADEETGATSKPGVFAGGDTVIGAATVILAMGAGKRAAAGIANYLLK